MSYTYSTVRLELGVGRECNSKLGCSVGATGGVRGEEWLNCFAFSLEFKVPWPCIFMLLSTL